MRVFVSFWKAPRHVWLRCVLPVFRGADMDDPLAVRLACWGEIDSDFAGRIGATIRVLDEALDTYGFVAFGFCVGERCGGGA